MALHVLNNARILAGQADLSGWTNEVSINAEVEELDSTTFNSLGWKEVRPGLRNVSFETKGFWEASHGGYPDDRLMSDLGVSGVVMSVSTSGLVGDPAYFSRVLRPQYSFGDQVGQLVPYTSKAVGDGAPLVRGQIADYGDRASTATTTVLTLQVPSATTRVYAGIHVLAVSGTGTPTLTATLQGDSASGFPSPATVATSSAITAVGSHWLAGPLGVTSDAYYRLSYVISGTNPTFSLAAFIGLGA